MRFVSIQRILDFGIGFHRVAVTARRRVSLCLTTKRGKTVSRERNNIVFSLVETQLKTFFFVSFGFFEAENFVRLLDKQNCKRIEESPVFSFSRCIRRVERVATTNGKKKKRSREKNLIKIQSSRQPPISFSSFDCRSSKLIRDNRETSIHIRLVSRTILFSTRCFIVRTSLRICSNERTESFADVPFPS